MILRGAYAGSLGFCEDGGRHNVETNMVLLTENTIHNMDSLHLCGVGKHLTTVDIANRKDFGFCDYLKVIIDGDGTTTTEIYAYSLKT